MKKYLSATWMLLVAGIAATALTACIFDASASSGVSRTEFNNLSNAVASLKTDLTAAQANITGLQSEIATLRGSTNVVSTGGGSTKNSEVEGDTFAYIGWLPADKPVYQAQSLQMRSDTGYLFALPAPQGGFPLRATVYFGSADCSGTPYISINDLSEYGRNQGAVFSYGNSANPDSIGYVVPGTEQTSGLMLSRHKDGNCFSGSFDFPVALLSEVLPNDPVVTSVQNEAYPGPVVMQ